MNRKGYIFEESYSKMPSAKVPLCSTLAQLKSWCSLLTDWHCSPWNLTLRFFREPTQLKTKSSKNIRFIWKQQDSLKCLTHCTKHDQSKREGERTWNWHQGGHSSYLETQGVLPWIHSSAKSWENGRLRMVLTTGQYVGIVLKKGIENKRVIFS